MSSYLILIVSCLYMTASVIEFWNGNNFPRAWYLFFAAMLTFVSDLATKR
jgi:hypothetical protein